MTSITKPSIIAHAAIREHSSDIASKVADAATDRQMGHNHNASVLMDEIIAHAKAVIAIAEAERAKCVIASIAK
jgi:hypothetical protein